MKELINLDQAVLNALDLFSQKSLPKFKSPFKNPIIIGSGNASALGKLLFKGTHANESTYKKALKESSPDGAILISASAGKHSPKIAKYLKSKKIKTILLTNNPEGQANKFVTKSITFPKNPEPYTYNTSTYLGLILSRTKENPKTIKAFLQKLRIPTNLKKYNSYMLILPEKFDPLREFFETKFEELFGPKIQGKAFTFEETKHAKTVIESSKELFVGLGIQNKTFGKNRINFSIPRNASFGLMFCLGYYFIGKIQGQNPAWFKRSIGDYVRKASRLFGQKISVRS